MIDLVPGHAAGPDHAPGAQVDGLRSLEHAGHGQAAVILVALVPALLRDRCGREKVGLVRKTAGRLVYIYAVIT